MTVNSDTATLQKIEKQNEGKAGETHKEDS